MTESGCFDETASGDVLVARTRGRCVFFDAHHDRLCRIHADLDHDALPLACRQFPRVSLIDPRGVSLTLSHYCPTAAGLLTAMDEDGAVSIVDSPPAFPPDGEYVGLDADTSLPPLLKPDMLMDWESWWEWERRSVALLVGGCSSSAEALTALAGAIENIRAWTPADGSLAGAIDRAFHHGSVEQRAAPPSSQVLLDDVRSAVPAQLQRPLQAEGAMPEDRVIRRFLAAHAFANWTAHLGQGLRTWHRSLAAAFAFVDLGFGVRQADLYLRHLADPYALAKIWSADETR
jgi:hypothetical protein